MAKVWGPIHSDDARGKFAKSMVFMGWKGIKTVRQYVIPANPKSIHQGDVRLVLGGLGRAIGKIVASSAIHNQLTTENLIPDQQTRQSFLVQFIRDNYLAGTKSTFTAAYQAMMVCVTGHTRYAEWQLAADDLRIYDFDINYASINPFRKSLGIYLIAKACIALGFTGSPYTIALASWSTGNLAEFTADFLRA